jgi:hypothetical protein
MILYENYINSWVALPQLRLPIIQRMTIRRKLGMENFPKIPRMCALDGAYYGAKLRAIT